MSAIREGYIGRMRREILALGIVAAALYAVDGNAQAPAPQAQGRGGANKQAAAPARGGGGGGAAYPQRTPDPAAVTRGKAIYDVNCALCHGDDARGGDNGPNLIRGEVVMNDQNGESIGKVLGTGKVGPRGCRNFDFTPAQVADTLPRSCTASGWAATTPRAIVRRPLWSGTPRRAKRISNRNARHAIRPQAT